MPALIESVLPYAARTSSRKRAQSFSAPKDYSPPEVIPEMPVTPGSTKRSSRSSSAHSTPRVRFSEPAPPPPTAAQPRLKIHRTLACAPGAPALLYDIVHPPSHHNILSAQTMLPVPPHTLNLAATLPRVATLSLSLALALTPSSSSSSASTSVAIAPAPVDWSSVRVTSTTSSGAHAITSLDVLHAVYTALHQRVSRKEWEALGRLSSSKQQRVSDAYARRCRITGEWDGGVRRCDWLGSSTTLVGIESRSDGVYELIFIKA